VHGSYIEPLPTSTNSSNEMKKDEQGIMALAAQFANAFVKRDAVAMDKLLAENYIETRPNGIRLSKTDLVNRLKAPLPENAGTLNMPEMSSPIIRMFGDTAIMSARVTTSGKDAKGEAFNENLLYTMTAVENNGRWQIAAMQSIEIGSKIPPAGMGNHCKFDKGPRAGQTQDYSTLKAYPLGTPCYDGRGSTGKLVAP
ncbi:MAG: nuclear transport factor 2 family protein, partial [Aridibacter sp.]